MFQNTKGEKVKYEKTLKKENRWKNRYICISGHTSSQMTISFKTFLWFDITRNSLNLRNQRVSTILSNTKVSSKGHGAFFGKIVGNTFSKLRYLNDDRFGLSISSSNSFSHASNVNILSLCAEILTLSNMMQPLTSKVSRWGI